MILYSRFQEAMARFLPSGPVRILLFLVILGVPLSLTASSLWIHIRSKGRIFSTSAELTTNLGGRILDCAIVPGARVFDKGILSTTLRDRVEAALEMYRAGAVKKILLSGDHGTVNYDEVNAMRDFLLKRGVAEDDLFTDHAGFDTHDTMARAARIFKVSNALVCTQAYHLPRAIALARSWGLDALGLVADRHVYIDSSWMSLRERLAGVKALGVILLGIGPRFLGPEIPITGSGKPSWDRPAKERSGEMH